MALLYKSSPLVGWLRQGELLSDVWEHRPLHPTTEVALNKTVPLRNVRHALVIMLSPACDLEWDFKARFPEDSSAQSSTSPVMSGAADLQAHSMDESHGALMPHTILCDVYTRDEVLPLVNNAGVLKRVEKHQDERYQYFPSAFVGEERDHEVPGLYIDFKKTFALPTASIYRGIATSAVDRIGIVPAIYIHDLVHRFYSFLSRVALPE